MQGLCQIGSLSSDTSTVIMGFGPSRRAACLTLASLLIACTRLVVDTAPVPLPNKEPCRSTLIVPLLLGIAPQSSVSLVSELA